MSELRQLIKRDHEITVIYIIFDTDFYRRVKEKLEK